MSHISGQPEVMLPPTPVAAPSPRFADFVQLSKLRITLMVVITAYMGFGFGIDQSMLQADLKTWVLLFAMLVGTSLSCMGASVLNQIYERDTDGLMPRTRNRPLPAGRVSPMHAGIFATVLCVLGLGILGAGTNLLTTALSAFTIASYVLFYTPMKRVSSASTIIGAVPGAIPPLMGFAAAKNTLGPEAWILFGILFLWQLPHFLAIAWLYREDYALAGLPMLPVVDPSGSSTFRQIMLGCLALLPLGLLPTMLGISGLIYFFGALICGLGFLLLAVRLVLKQGRSEARALFFASLIYLPVVFGLMLVDRT